MEKGLIVSIQGYSQETTQELADNIQNNIVGIRTDQPIKIKVPVIALEKLEGKKYYITSTVDSIMRCRWGDFVAIDCRRGNFELQLLLAYAQIHKIKIIADIETFKDFEYIFDLGKSNGFVLPAYFATTFSFFKTGNQDFSLINNIKNQCDTPIIAEGKIKTRPDAKRAYECGASNVCVGAEISDIKYLTNKFIVEDLNDKNKMGKRKGTKKRL